METISETTATELAERVRHGRKQILAELRKVIVGQDECIDQVLIALFTGGHCLITGVPGLAKTLMIKTCLLYTSPSPRDGLLSRMPSSA